MTRDIYNTTRIPNPGARPLRVYAFDPSVGKFIGKNMTVRVRYEALKPGPVGKRFAVTP